MELNILEKYLTFLFENIGIYYGLLPWIWNNSSYYIGEQGEIIRSFYFIAVQMILSIFTSTPFSLYRTFGISDRHGMNKMTLDLFVKDKIKGLILTAVIGCPIMALLLKLVEWGGDNFHNYVFIFFVTVSFLMTWIYPNFI